MRRMLKIKRDKSSALVFCVTILALLSFLAISFANSSRMEMNASKNISQSLQARFLALAGLEYCNSRLREEASQIRRDAETWKYTDKISVFHFSDWQCSEDLEKWFSTDIENLEHPSYSQRLAHSSKKDDRTGEIEIQNIPSFYTCRIIDNNSKINIKGEYTNLIQQALEKLFEELDINDGKDLAENIVKKDKTKYSSLEDIKTDLDIKESTWEKISPYICIESASEQIYDPDSKELKSYYPININAAPREILVAIFSELEGETFLEGKKVSLSSEKIKKFVDAIFDKKFAPRRYFLSWDDFAKFLNESSIFSVEEVSLLFANACPFVLPNHKNPDKHVKWAIDRTQLKKYGIPCTLYPGGIFSIESMGTYCGLESKSKSKVSMTARIFSQFIHHTQEDFHQNRVISSVAGDMFQATTGPNPIGHLLAEMENNDDIAKINSEVKPDESTGWIMRTNGLNNEASLHFKGNSSDEENLKTNCADGKISPIYLSPPFPEEERGNLISFDFFFKPSDEFDKSTTTPIFRNFSLDDGISTEIYWDEQGYLRAARTLCCSKELEYPDPETRQNKMKIYKGVLKPEGFQELLKIGTTLYKDNLDSWSITFGVPPISSICYSEVADPNFAAEFGYVFATKIYRALAQGIDKEELPITMKYGAITLTIFLYPIVLPPFFIPVPIPVVQNGLERKLVISLSEYHDIVFQDGPEIFEVEREPDQLSLRNVTLNFIPPVFHPNPVSRSEYRIEETLDPSIWYRLKLVWDGIEIKQFTLSHLQGIIEGQEIKEMCDTPLNVWRIMDITMEHQSEFAAPGTYLYANRFDVARYKNSCFQGKFEIPNFRRPEFANMAVTKFLPESSFDSNSKNRCDVYSCLYSEDEKKWFSNYSTNGGLVKEIRNYYKNFTEAEYLLFLSGNLYETPVVPEIRLRILHETIYSQYRIF